MYSYIWTFFSFSNILTQSW